MWLLHFKYVKCFFFMYLKNNPASKAINYSHQNVLGVSIGMIHWIHSNGVTIWFVVLIIIIFKNTYTCTNKYKKNYSKRTKIKCT